MTALLTRTTDVRILELVENARLTLVPYSQRKPRKPRQLVCLPTIEHVYREYGTIVTSAALGAMSTAWPDEPLRYGAQILRGLAQFYAAEMAFVEAFDPDIAEETVAAFSQEEWVAKAQRHQEGDGHAMQRALTEEYLLRLKQSVSS